MRPVGHCSRLRRSRIKDATYRDTDGQARRALRLRRRGRGHGHAARTRARNRRSRSEPRAEVWLHRGRDSIVASVRHRSGSVKRLHEAVHRLRQPQGNRERSCRSASSTASPPTRRCSPRSRGDYREILKKICQIVQGADERRSGRHRRRGHAPRRPRPRQHRPAHRRQGAVHAGWRQGLQDAVVRRQEGQRHALLLADAGADRREGRRDLHQPVRRPPRRHRDLRHEPDSARSSRSTRTTSSRPKCSSPRRAARCTSSKRRGWARTSAPARRR